MDRILLTGASGTIGAWTWQALRTSFEVISIGRQQVDLLRHGRFADCIFRNKPDIVLHLAWSASGMHGYRYSDDNARWADATLVAAATCLNSGIRFIGTGTVLDDASVLQAPDDYVLAKQRLRTALDEEIVAGAITWLRPFYVLDVKRGRPRLMEEALKAKVRNEPIQLVEPGVRHDFVLASDVGRAMHAVVAHKLTGSVDIGSGVDRSVADVVEAVGARWDGGEQRVGVRREPVADLALLRAAGWAPLETEKFFAPPTSRVEQ